MTYVPIEDADYGEDRLAIARSRGWDETAHRNALIRQDEDAVTLTHPFNWLTEQEVES